MKAGAVGNVRLIDEAQANPFPLASRANFMSAAGALLGAVIASGFVLLRYKLYKEIDSPDDLAKLNAPTLAIVPLSQHQRKFDRRREVVLLADRQPGEMATEAMRALRTNLFSSMFDKDRNIIAITGPSPTVGKSFISSNLAYLTAKTGARVLVIDADMRRGSLGKNFNVPQNVPGLAQLLDGTQLPESIMHKVDLDAMQVINANEKRESKKLHHTLNHDLGSIEYDLNDTFTGLDVIPETKPSKQTNLPLRSKQTPYITVVPRGQSVNNPSELLMHQRLPEFLEYASQHFDLVIVDTPPVLAATDAMIVGKYADINLMVVRHGETTVHEADEVARTFSNNRIRLNGIVLNGYDSTRGRYGKYGTHYGYKYDYS